jgi:predicted benzoate:H+ symporter BenE
MHAAWKEGERMKRRYKLLIATAVWFALGIFGLPLVELWLVLNANPTPTMGVLAALALVVAAIGSLVWVLWPNDPN